uniref:Glutathionylspermidine synthase n=1 Tax=Lygus hesperus TaxID=30085 RepID=A0A0A9Y170_LYGHE
MIDDDDEERYTAMCVMNFAEAAGFRTKLCVNLDSFLFGDKSDDHTSNVANAECSLKKNTVITESMTSAVATAAKMQFPSPVMGNFTYDDDDDDNDDVHHSELHLKHDTNDVSKLNNREVSDEPSYKVETEWVNNAKIVDTEGEEVLLV